MFSLPLITPIHDFTAYLPHHLPTTARDPSDPSTTQPDHPNNQPAPQRRQNAPPNPNSTLAALKADEEAIRRRKENIARFGATWIRPPAVVKTLQAETEERIEREEQETIARREQMLADMQARQEQEELRARAAENGGEGEEGEERDLDGDVPEAEEEEGEEDEDSEMDSSAGNEGEEGLVERDLDDDVPDAEREESSVGGETEAHTTAGEVSFNEVSLIEGSMLADRPGEDEENGEDNRRERLIQERYAALEEAELTGAVQEEYDLGMEGNLDDSVPDAGSYEHTDTELEDDSSDAEEGSFSATTSGLGVSRQGSQRRGLFDNTRRSLGGRVSGGSTGSRGSLSNRDASSLLESSFVTSSPVVGRLRSGGQRGGRNR